MESPETNLIPALKASIGLLMILSTAFLCSSDRRYVPWRAIVLWFAFLLVLTPLLGPGKDIHWGARPLGYLSDGVATLIGFSDEGIRFLWGELSKDKNTSWGFVFVIRILPVIVYFSSVMAVLFYFGIAQWVIRCVGWIIHKLFGPALTGPEATVAAANIFLSHTEAPLFVRPYVARMTRSQLMTMMTCGFATTAAVMVVSLSSLFPECPEEGMGNLLQHEVRYHLLISSVLNALAGIILAKIMVPEVEPHPVQALSDEVDFEDAQAGSVFNALSAGALRGVRLAVAIGAMLIVFKSVLAMLSSATFKLSGFELQTILGWILYPLEWCLGFETASAADMGKLMGTELVATEFIAFVQLAQLSSLSKEDALIALYVLCSFANLPSIGVQVAALNSIAPERRQIFARLAPRAMFAGLLAACFTACLIRILFTFFGSAAPSLPLECVL